MATKIQIFDELTPLVLLKYINTIMPGMWRTIDEKVLNKPQIWPSWCFCPTGPISHILIDRFGEGVIEEDLLADAVGVTKEEMRSWLKNPQLSDGVGHKQFADGWQAHQYQAATLVSRMGPCLQALVSWRLTQGVYRFDPTLLKALLDTPTTGTLPVEVFDHLPEWCVYIDLSDQPLEMDDAANKMKFNVTGYFVTLDWEQSDVDGAPNKILTTLVFTDRYNESGMQQMEIWGCILKPGNTIRDGVDQYFASGSWYVNLPQDKAALYREAMMTTIPQNMAILLSPVLYLCSEKPDVEGRGMWPPPKPVGTKTKNGIRHFPIQVPQSWGVGVRIGPVLRMAEHKQACANGEFDGRGGRTPRPHVRRAHWHLYWTGPRQGERTAILKWLHPMIVNATQPGELIPVIRRVEE